MAEKNRQEGGQCPATEKQPWTTTDGGSEGGKGETHEGCGHEPRWDWWYLCRTRKWPGSARDALALPPYSAGGREMTYKGVASPSNPC